MFELLFNFISLLAFVGGIVLGELLANRAFGRPRSALVSLLDLVLMVFLVSLLYTYMEFYTQELLYCLINLALGALSITIIRAAEWLLRLTERAPGLGGNERF